VGARRRRGCAADAAFARAQIVLIHGFGSAQAASLVAKLQANLETQAAGLRISVAVVQPELR
jgi:chloramphenicol 3-O-phosphotransferase